MTVKYPLVLTALVWVGCAGENPLDPVLRPGEDPARTTGAVPAPFPRGSALTMEEVFHSPITEVARETIRLRAQLTWDEFHPYDWDAMTYDVSTTLVDRIAVSYEEADSHMDPSLQGQQRGDTFVVGRHVRKVVDDHDVQHYFFRDQRLERGVVYELLGRFEYREWISPPPLDDPRFIRQSNDPAYWRQTFEFQVVHLSRASE